MKQVKIFLAAPYNEDGINWAKNVKNMLTVEVCSTWHDSDLNLEATLDEIKQGMQKNLEEIGEATDIFIYDPQNSTTGGCWVEFGYALALNKGVYIFSDVDQKNPYAMLDVVRTYKI